MDNIEAKAEIEEFLNNYCTVEDRDLARERLHMILKKATNRAWTSGYSYGFKHNAD